MRADVAIAGASFAGLGLAYHLRDSGLDVLLIDKKDIGEKRTSTCGVPETIAKEIAPDSILNTVEYFHVETNRIKRTLEVPRYSVIDYKKFCTALFKKSGARFLKAEASPASEAGIETSAGKIEAKFRVDCTGWRRALSPARPRKFFTGIEITAPIGERFEGSFNFFIDRSLIHGYAWVLPIGGGLGHVGIGGNKTGGDLNRALMEFLGRVEVPFTRNGLVGGAIPCEGPGKTVENGIFFVGDSARQVLPLSGEGIKTSHCFSRLCADAIKKNSSVEDALKLYEKTSRKPLSGFYPLALVQKGMTTLPQLFFDFCVFTSTSRFLRKKVTDSYFSIGQ